uniref:Uncharacterized protein n=1 Tax=Arundo donax TaxID=35708 RepID=A0A0A8YJ14_ARUDO
MHGAVHLVKSKTKNPQYLLRFVEAGESFMFA